MTAIPDARAISMMSILITSFVSSHLQDCRWGPVIPESNRLPQMPQRYSARAGQHLDNDDLLAATQGVAADSKRAHFMAAPRRARDDPAQRDGSCEPYWAPLRSRDKAYALRPQNLGALGAPIIGELAIDCKFVTTLRPRFNWVSSGYSCVLVRTLGGAMHQRVV
jgi:hypothetical protein